MNNERRATRINYLRNSIEAHAANRDEQIARGVNAEWIDSIDAANRQELEWLLADIAAEQREAAHRADAAAEEARMGRILRAAARRGEF